MSQKNISKGNGWWFSRTGNTNPHIQEAEQNSSRLNKNKYTTRHIIRKLPNTIDKEQNLKSKQKKKAYCFKRSSNRADF